MRSRNLFTLSKTSLIAFICLMPCFMPAYFEVIAGVPHLYGILQRAAVPIAAFMIFRYKNRWVKISTTSKLLISSHLVVLIVTFVSSDEMWTNAMALNNLLLITSLALVIEWLAYDWEKLCSVLLLHFEICIYANIISVLLFPERLYGKETVAYGLTHEWFLGSMNGFLKWIIPGLCVALICSFEKFEKKSINIRGVVLLLAIVFQLIIKGSGTAKLGAIVLLILVFLPVIKKIFTPKLVLLAAGIIFVLIVVNRDYDAFSWIIVDILGKDLTFTNRLDIWDNSIKAISENFVFGYGILSYEEMASYLGWAGATHCHDLYLQLLFQGGVIGFIIFILAQIMASFNLSKNWGEKVVSIIAISIFVYNLIGITEAITEALYFIPILLGANYKKEFRRNQISQFY